MDTNKNPSAGQQTAVSGQNGNLEVHAQKKGSTLGPRPPVRIAKGTPSSQKFTPIVKIDTLRDESRFNCILLVKCSHLNESGLTRYALGLQMFGHSPPHDLLTTWSRHDLGLGLCYAAAKKGNPHTSMVKIAEKFQPNTRLTDNDADLLRCFGTTIIANPSSTTLLDYQARADIGCNHDRLMFKYAMAKDVCKKLGTTHSSSSSFTDDKYGLSLQNELIQPIYEIIVQTKGRFDLLVCDIAMARVLLASKILDELLQHYDVACVEEHNPHGESGETLMSVDFHVSGRIVTFKVPLSAGRAVTYGLLHEEGILCSAKSGLIMAGAVIAAKEYGYHKNLKAKVVTLLPEGIFHETRPESLEQDWMLKNKLWTKEYFERNQCWWWDVSLPELGLKPIVITYPTMAIEEAIQLMREFKVDRAGVGYQDTDRSTLEGVVFLSALEAYVNCDDLEYYEERVGNPGDTPVSSVMSTSLEYGNINHLNMGAISSVLVHTDYLVVTLNLDDDYDGHQHRRGRIRGRPHMERVAGILSSEDLIKYKNRTLLEHLDHGYNLKG